LLNCEQAVLFKNRCLPALRVPLPDPEIAPQLSAGQALRKIVRKKNFKDSIALIHNDAAAALHELRERVGVLDAVQPHAHTEF
jgi:hypothetical protein